MHDDLPEAKSFPVTIVLFEGMLAVVAALIGWAIGSPVTATLSLDRLGFLGGVTGTIPPLILFWLTYKLPFTPFKNILAILEDAVIPLFRQCRLAEIAIIALMAGVGEELLFRAIVQQGIVNWIGLPYGLYAGLIVAALAFGLIHALTPTYALLAALMGLYFGILWLLTDNILVPILVHALYDFLVLAFFVFIRKSPMVEEKNSLSEKNGE